MREETHRTRVIHVRLTEKEYAEMRTKVETAGITVSEFVRRAASGRRIVSKVEKNLVNELRKIGGLLKLVHNESGGAYSARTAAAIEDIRDAVRRVERV